MLPAITTTHAIPQRLPSGDGRSQTMTVRCCYCLEVLGEARDMNHRDRLQRAHHCKAKRVAKKPAAAVPYN